MSLTAIRGRSRKGFSKSENLFRRGIHGGTPNTLKT